MIAGGSFRGPSFSFGLLSPESELSLGGVGDPLGLLDSANYFFRRFWFVEKIVGSALEISQLCQGGYCSLEESFGVAKAVPIIAPNLVLLVMLEIGGASGNVTLLGFLGMSNPEIVGWRFTDF
jgi:hypothetical protein